MKLSPKLNLPIPEGSDIHNLTNFVALLNAIDNNSAPLGAMNDHINNKNNPHAVTKTQVGLGQVNNVPQYSKSEMDSKLSDLSKLTQLPTDSVPSTGTPASFPIGITAMTVTSGDYPGVTTNSPGTLMTVRGSNDRGAYQLLSGNGTPQQRAYDGAAWGGWSTVATTASNVASASKLANARKIGGVNFDGTSDVTLPGVNAPGNQSTSGKAATAGRADEATHADNATSANKLTTARKIGGVNFDGSADIALPGVNTAGNQDTSGNARTAAKLQTARNINGVGFDGSSDITINPVIRYTDSNTDLSTLANGYYFFYGASTTPNKPAGAGNYFTVEVAQVQTDGSMYLLDSNGLSFWRQKANGKWRDWHQYADNTTVVHNSGNETIAGTKTFSDALMAPAGIKGDVTGSLHGNADTAKALALNPFLADGTDLNTVQTPGLYPWKGAIFKNGPTGTQTWGYMSVINIGTVIQAFYSNGSNQVYYRIATGSPLAWTAWAKVIFDNDTITNATHADTAGKLTTARKIGGVNFDGSADISLPGVNVPGNQPTSGKAATADRASTAGRADTAGTADTAIKLNAPCKIGGVGFDGTANINLPGVNTPGNQNTSGKAATAGKADEATHAAKADSATTANSATTAEYLLNARSRELTDADRGNDTTNITALTGTLKRTGNLVTFYAHFTVTGTTTISYTMLNAVRIPVGYRCSASAMPISIGQDGQDTSSGNDLALVTDDVVLIQTHGVNGSTYIGGVWITADDLA